ncbi:hypothetical protein ACFP9V_21385 [Deinococcus radiopugnans]|uniref:hypothetical protein n=1 Tax=Deinococcus radiopugnans TaxID=57497 RepID=UPI0036241941
MSVYLHTIALALPETAYPQSVIRDVIKAQPELDRLAKRLTGAAFNASGIDQRYSVVKEFADTDGGAGLFYDPANTRMLNPTTGQRNIVYAQEATKLYVDAARKALADSRFGAADITHVITVSCTGFLRRDRTTPSCGRWGWAATWAATTWASWAATRPFPP